MTHNRQSNAICIRPEVSKWWYHFVSKRNDCPGQVCLEVNFEVGSSSCFRYTKNKVIITMVIDDHTYWLCSICVHSFGSLAKAIRLFTISFQCQKMAFRCQHRFLASMSCSFGSAVEQAFTSAVHCSSVGIDESVHFALFSNVLWRVWRNVYLT